MHIFASLEREITEQGERIDMFVHGGWGVGCCSCWGTGTGTGAGSEKIFKVQNNVNTSALITTSSSDMAISISASASGDTDSVSVPPSSAPLALVPMLVVLADVPDLMDNDNQDVDVDVDGARDAADSYECDLDRLEEEEEDRGDHVVHLRQSLDEGQVRGRIQDYLNDEDQAGDREYEHEHEHEHQREQQEGSGDNDDGDYS
ncbi:hypothetical protein CVT25_010261 [Psilocybe cyanescens]|uniref:Uncharacterized protein n=1 Tax=Psilocybe cyanescens TaxID=93625 RepID=A0A409XD45_PSICY|nr:hypothetical protein CVT25_010261 [Psilocybe cyanescens]